MSRPLMSAVTLAVLSTLPVLSTAAPAPRFSAAASLAPKAVASGGRFSLQAQLDQPGAAAPSDAKQPDPPRRESAASAARYRLLSAVRDKSAPEGAICLADILLQNGFE